MIFCVEDDGSIRELMIYTLNSVGFEAKGFVCGDELFNALRTEKPQLIMLDIMLPGEDGICILKRLRQQNETADIPVIMATAKGTEYDKVNGLDLGADDYLAKPFGMMEMVSRIRAVLRRTSLREIMQGRPELWMSISAHLGRSLENAAIISKRCEASAIAWRGAYDKTYLPLELSCGAHGFSCINNFDHGSII